MRLDPRRRRSARSATPDAAAAISSAAHRHAAAAAASSSSIWCKHAWSASARLRHLSALLVSSDFRAGAVLSSAARSKCSAASTSSAAERCRTSHTLKCSPLSRIARMLCARTSFGAAFTTLADSALRPSSFHHSGLVTSAQTFSRNKSKAAAAARAHRSEPTGVRSMASRYRCAASTRRPELESTLPRLKYASRRSGLRAMASR
eukprot:scaffold11233_cov59-Phaeocystis_antarctica.AAC.4